MSEAALSVAAALWVGSAAPASAFTEPRTYFASPVVGGGGGRWFTGSPAEGYACSVCHTPEGSARLELTGLPESSYTPGKTYDVELSWPEVAERARELREMDEGPASLSLVAEVVAESGEGGGTLQIAPADDAEPEELCAFPEGALAAQLYRVQPGHEPLEAGTRCTSDALGERCLVAVVSCGAEKLRFKWTAPETDQGTVWFAAGFVATEKVSGDPNGDQVTELQVPILGGESDADVYVNELVSGCRVVAPGSSRAREGLEGDVWWLVAGATLWLAARRRRGGGA